jgi:hypothetical protein
MAVFLNNQIAILKNIFRFPEAPTIKYIKGALSRKLRRLPQHINHYDRFARVGILKAEEYWSVGDLYPTYLKIIADIFEVKVIWKNLIQPTNGQLQKGAVLIGFPSDVDILTDAYLSLGYITDYTVHQETTRYNKMVTAQRRKRQRGNITEKFEHSRVYSRKFKDQIVRYINTLLLEILENKKRSPNYKLHYQLIAEKYKLEADRRGNPNWNGNYDRWEKKTARHLKFQNNKLLN